MPPHLLLPPPSSAQLVGTVAGLSRGVFSVDFSPATRELCLAGGDAAVRVYEIQELGGHGAGAGAGADEAEAAGSAASEGKEEAKGGK